MSILARCSVWWFCVFAAVVFGVTRPVAAQCNTPWVPEGNLMGANGPVLASTMWDPDGPGPAAARLVLGGTFSAAGNLVVANIVVNDPVAGTWSALGSGTNGAVYALAASPSGELFAGGLFTTAGGVAADHVARWDGASWSALGTGVGGPGASTNVLDLRTMPNGDLVAGGGFTTAGGVAAENIARWDGVSWSSLGAGTDGPVYSLIEMPNGDLIAGGFFTTAGGAPANGIARWDGVSWSPLGSGMAQPAIFAMTLLPNGDLIAGGHFTTAGGVSASGLARWNGSAWSAVGSTSLPRPTLALATTTNGDLISGHNSQAMRWDGSVWRTISYSPGEDVSTLTALPGGGVVAGGDKFTGRAGAWAPSTGLRVAQWDGNVWSPLAPGWWNQGPVALLANPDGSIVAGGAFSATPGGAANGIARWNGTSWSALGPGFNDVVWTLATLTNGDLVAGGMFTLSGSTVLPRIARWDGVSWSPIVGVSGPPDGHGNQSSLITCILPLANNSFVVCGSFIYPGNNITLWNGAAWAPLGVGTNGTVRTVVKMPNGDLIAGGTFTTAGGVAASGIARWDGSTWWPLGSGLVYPSSFGHGGAYACVAMPNGDLVVGGNLTGAGGVAANGIARWDGSTWWPLGAGLSGEVTELVVLPNGDLVAGGTFPSAGGVAVNNIARWNGVSWSAFGSGTSSGRVTALALLPNGDLAVGGSFTHVDGSVSPYLSRITTTCPATTTTFASGCPSSGGPNLLTAETLPWVDATFVATGSGLPPSCFVLSVYGLTPVVPGFPIANVLVEALPGCDLHVTPDGIDTLFTSTGTVSSHIYLVNAPAFIGVEIHHQMVPVVVDGGGFPVEISATNAIRLTTGMF